MCVRVGEMWGASAGVGLKSPQVLPHVFSVWGEGVWVGLLGVGMFGCVGVIGYQSLLKRV